MSGWVKGHFGTKSSCLVGKDEFLDGKVGTKWVERHGESVRDVYFTHETWGRLAGCLGSGGLERLLGPHEALSFSVCHLLGTNMFPHLLKSKQMMHLLFFSTPRSHSIGPSPHKGFITSL